MGKRIEEDSRIFGDSTDSKLKKLGKVLEDTREVSMQEVIFRLFGYSMCSSSRKKKFIQTLPPEKRDGLIKPNIEELDDKDDIFCYNIIDYYQNRPDSLEHISLASFGANYEYYKTMPNKKDINKDYTIDDNIQEDDNNEDEENITEQKLVLKNNMGYLKARKKRSIIRYFKGKYDDDITRIRCVMLLFYPFRNEVIEVHNNENILDKYKECQEEVEEEQRLFEPHPEFMDFLENIEQENIEEDEEQQEQLDNDFVEEDTTKPEEVQDWLKKQGKVYDGTKIRLEDKKKLNKRINTLNFQQRKILDELMDIDDEKQYFLYLYGQAGTGKTYLLNTIIPALEFKSLKSGVDLDKPLILVMSPTASAAKHLVYGDTIHGALKINGFNNLEKQLLHGANATLSHDLSQVKHVIIDEISMVGANFFWDINQKLKQIMGSQEYFGGLNVIATGDFHQLPPVGDVWIFNRTSIRGRCNAVATNIWKVYFKMYKLTEHVRSEGDQDYSLLQEEIAIGKVSQDMYEKLNERVQAICDTEDNNDWYKDGKQIMITPTHDTKDRFNEKRLRNLNGEMILFAAKDNPSKRTPILPNFLNLNEQKTKGLLSMLKIKIGCPIKITININKKDSLVNGTFGYVCDVDQEQDIIWCIFSNKVGEVTRRNFGKSHDIYKNAIPIVRHTEQLKLTYERKQYTFKRSQFPLVLAYAITCYASQGITKERVIIDYTGNRQKHALFSVPFSRGKTLDGIFLKSFKKM